MRSVDRLLLYVVSVALAVILIAGERLDSAADPGFTGASLAPETVVENLNTPRRRHSDDRASAIHASPEGEELHENSIDGTSNIAEMDRIELVDSQGRPRLELSLNESDEPQLLMRAESGKVMIRMTCDVDGQSTITLGETDSNHITVSNSPDGSRSVELVGSDGAAARLALTHNGAADLRLIGHDPGDELVLRQNSDEGAKVGLRSSHHDGSVAIQLDSSGVASLNLMGPDGSTGPVLNVFEDGLAEVSINGGSSDSGPSLIRMPDGLAIVAARRPDGKPGASMVAAPDGQSVVAATNSDGSQQAELRVDEQGVPSVGIVSPEEPQETIPRRVPPPEDDTVVWLP